MNQQVITFIRVGVAAAVGYAVVGSPRSRGPPPRTSTRADGPKVRWYSLLTSLSVNTCVCVVRHSKEEDVRDVIVSGPIGV